MVLVSVDKDVWGKQLPCTLRIDRYEKNNLDALAHKLEKDWDVIGMVVGYEGDGKSVFALQKALYFDADFNVDKIVFTAHDFEELINSDIEKKSCILWDESDALGSHWASQVTQVLTKTFKRIRKKNLVIILVTPTFFDLNKYFALHRISFLVEVYSQGFTRGFFRFFGRGKLRKLYIDGKRYWNMKAATPNLLGRFNNLPPGFPVNIGSGSEYDLKKDKATAEIAGETVNPNKIRISVRDKCVNNLYNNFEGEFGKPISVRAVARVTGFSYGEVRESLKKQEKA